MKNLTPAIVAIGYNRYKSLERLLISLNRAYYEEDVTLIISIDFGGSQDIVSLAESFQWYHGNKIVRTFGENQGLKKHILQCIDYSIEYGAVIIFEDDIVPSPFFYDYTKQALNMYAHDARIFALALYSSVRHGHCNKLFFPLRNGTDTYLMQDNCTWGECFIGEQWKNFREWYDNNGEDLQYRDDVPPEIFKWTNSWAKYVTYYMITNELYFVVPYDSLSTNFHEAGIHSSESTPAYQVPLMYGKKEYHFAPFETMIKYDAFLESIELKERIEKVYEKKVCIDCYGCHAGYGDADLLLSPVHLPNCILESYGLDMVQPELNYVYEVPGNDLFLYDMHKENTNNFVQEEERRDKYSVMIKLLSQWIANRQRGLSISRYLETRGMKQVAIYGMGDLGQRLCDELADTDVIVEYAIDRRAEHIISSVRLINTEEKYEVVDAIIVTSVYDFEKVKRLINAKTECEILSLEKVVYAVSEEAGSEY